MREALGDGERALEDAARGGSDVVTDMWVPCVLPELRNHFFFEAKEEAEVFFFCCGQAGHSACVRCPELSFVN